jgi:hypothetical protein
VGLDNIWVLPEGVEHPVITTGRAYISGGMMSGPGDSGQCTSFRGKVYAEFIQTLSGHSLYEDELDDSAIGEIADSLEEFQASIKPLSGRELYEFLASRFEETIDSYQIEDCLETLDDLSTMFRKYSEIEGASLKSWY